MTTPYWILGIVAFVGILDVGTGLFLLFSKHPGLVNGAGTLWDTAPGLVTDPEAKRLVASLFERTGALTLHAGIVSLVVAAIGRTHPLPVAGFMALGMFDGVALNLVDRAYFEGTTYLASKYVIGTVWPVGFFVLVGKLRNADGREPPKERAAAVLTKSS